MVCSFPRLTKSEEMVGLMHQAYGERKKELSGKGEMGEGVTGRWLQLGLN